MLEVSAATAQPHDTAPKAVNGRAGFHLFLSELNPLQYIPVLGTIYRAVTGDTIPEAARMAGGLVVSGLAGGPIGVATNIALTAAEHVAGVDPEAIGLHVLAEVGVGATPRAAPAAAHTGPASLSQAETAKQQAPKSAHAQPAWSCAQLTAYGVTTDAGGDLHRGAVSGADVLNELELARVTAKPRSVSV